MHKLNKIKKGLLFIVAIIIIMLVIGEIYCKFIYKPKIILGDASIEEHPEGKVTEMSLKYLKKIKAAKEEDFGYSKDFFIQVKPFWWQAVSLEYYQALEERFDLEQIDYNFDFENHSYLLVYGRPINKLYSDTRTMYSDPVYGKVPNAKVEWDMDTPYESEIMYIYETDKIPLVDVEWN
ncbi:MAG: hypothetical protein HDQ97_03815 [Lachnospiraceae bacterium]|nr:hypothetical protein [Lachnospiraceae bacterium]